MCLGYLCFSNAVVFSLYFYYFYRVPSEGRLSANRGGQMRKMLLRTLKCFWLFSRGHSNRIANGKEQAEGRANLARLGAQLEAESIQFLNFLHSFDLVRFLRAFRFAAFANPCKKKETCFASRAGFCSTVILS